MAQVIAAEGWMNHDGLRFECFLLFSLSSHFCPLARSFLKISLIGVGRTITSSPSFPLIHADWSSLALIVLAENTLNQSEHLQTSVCEFIALQSGHLWENKSAFLHHSFHFFSSPFSPIRTIWSSQSIIIDLLIEIMISYVIWDSESTHIEQKCSNQVRNMFIGDHMSLSSARVTG